MIDHTQYDTRWWDTFLDLGFNKRIEVVAGFENTGSRIFRGQSAFFERGSCQVTVPSHESSAAPTTLATRNEVRTKQRWRETNDSLVVRLSKVAKCFLKSRVSTGPLQLMKMTGDWYARDRRRTRCRTMSYQPGICIPKFTVMGIFGALGKTKAHSLNLPRLLKFSAIGILLGRLVCRVFSYERSLSVPACPTVNRVGQPSSWSYFKRLNLPVSQPMRPDNRSCMLLQRRYYQRCCSCHVL